MRMPICFRQTLDKQGFFVEYMRITSSRLMG